MRVHSREKKHSERYLRSAVGEGLLPIQLDSILRNDTQSCRIRRTWFH